MVGHTLSPCQVYHQNLLFTRRQRLRRLRTILPIYLSIIPKLARIQTHFATLRFSQQLTLKRVYCFQVCWIVVVRVFRIFQFALWILTLLAIRTGLPYLLNKGTTTVLMFRRLSIFENAIQTLVTLSHSQQVP